MRGENDCPVLACVVGQLSQLSTEEGGTVVVATVVIGRGGGIKHTNCNQSPKRI